MNRYLPSAQFTLMVVALSLAAGLVYGAEYFSKAKSAPATLTASSVTPTTSQDSQSWEATLYAIQAQEGGAGGASIQKGAQDAAGIGSTTQNESLTSQVSRTLLGDIAGAASAQGTFDLSSQEQTLTDALGQLSTAPPSHAYGMRDITIVANSTTTLHTYGNTLVSVTYKDNVGQVRNTMIAVDNATSQQDPKQLAVLPSIQAQYTAYINDLLALPVPQTLAPFHLALINDLSRIADTYPGMQVLLSDPLRGMTALQTYQTTSDATLTVFINIASELQKDGILFTKDEPGAMLSALLSAQ